MTTKLSMDRREFLATTAVVGGGLAIGIGVPIKEAAAASVNGKPWLAPFDGAGVEVGSWVVIGADNSVTIRVPQNEAGQQVFTTSAMMVCEELECDWSKVGVMYIDVGRHLRENKVYGRISQGASAFVRESRIDLQRAGAAVRERLKLAAARRWNVPVGEVEAKKSVLTHRPTGRTFTYGQVAADAVSVTMDRPPAVKEPVQFTLMGTRVNQLGQDLRVSGTATFGIDVMLPDMLFAAVKMSPTQGGKLKSYDFNAIKGRRGVIAAVPIEGQGLQVDGVAVVADNWWRANTALSVMPVEWDAGPNANVSSGDIFAAWRKKMDEPGDLLTEIGDAEGVLKGAAKVVEAVYENNYLTHATIEPMNCTAQVTADRVEVWMGTQNPESVVTTAAAVTKMPPEKIFVRNCFVGTAFGRRLGNDDLRQALVVAMAMNGRPVQVLRSREEDMRHNPIFHPMGVAKLRGALGPDGMPVALTIRKAGDSQNGPTTVIRPDMKTRGLKAERYDTLVSRGFHEIVYAIPNQRVDLHHMKTPMATGSMRGTGSINNVFAFESFIDELAHAAGKDPYQYRRALIAANRVYEHRDEWLRLLDMAAQKIGWGKPLPKGTGLGIAIDDRRRPGLDQEFVTEAAVAAKVTVSQGGELVVEQLEIALDYGYAQVNPVAIEQQLRGQMVFALGIARDQEITLRNGRVVEGNFDDYPMQRIAEFPKEIGIQLIGSNKKTYGVGEEAMPSLAPALCNAIFAATGKRIRSLPLRNHDLSWT